MQGNTQTGKAVSLNLQADRLEVSEVYYDLREIWFHVGGSQMSLYAWIALNGTKQTKEILICSTPT